MIKHYQLPDLLINVSYDPEADVVVIRIIVTISIEMNAIWKYICN